MLLFKFVFAVLLATGSTALSLPRDEVSTPQPFDGLWAQTERECLDHEGPNSRTRIHLSNVVRGKRTPLLDQYEHHCRIENSEKRGADTTLIATCFEFWEYFEKATYGVKERIKVSSKPDGSLTINGKIYRRCQANTQREPQTSAAQAIVPPLDGTAMTTAAMQDYAGNSRSGDLILVVIIIIMAFIIYFLPAIVARQRSHHNAAAILLLNLFLGWTFLGWVVALVWASTTPHT